MAGLNLSKFKKISRDEKCTTLKSDDGHEIKIAHGSLSPKLKGQLDNLPVHMADGGFAGSVPDQNANPAMPSSAPEASPDLNQAPFDFNGYATQKHQDLLNEDAAMRHDIDNGYIKPKTYSDLFENKSTLGKVGTIFGMMLSGAGSGLAHQPNMLMQMMDNEINRDLDAQKNSATNRQNLYKINLDRNLNKAQIYEAYQRGHLSKEGVRKLEMENQILSHTSGLMGLRNFAVDHLQKNVNNLPDASPLKQQAAAALQNIKAAAAVKNADDAKKAAIGTAQLQQQVGGPDLNTIKKAPWEKMGLGSAFDVSNIFASPNEGAEEEKAAPEMPSNEILSPDADQKLMSMKAMSQYVPGTDKAIEQYDKARQAEQILGNVHDIMINMHDSAKAGGRKDYTRRELTPEAATALGAAAGAGTGAGGIGSAIGSAVGSGENLILGPMSANNKAFATNQARLYGDIRASLPHVSQEEVMRIVKANTPEYDDSANMVAKKEAAIKNFIKTNVQKGMLMPYKMLK